MNNKDKEDKMFVKRFLRVSAIPGLVIFVLLMTFGTKAGAESYSYNYEIVGQQYTWGYLQGPLDLSISLNDGSLFIADTGHQHLVSLDEYGNFENGCYLQGNDLVPLGVSVDPSGNMFYVTMTDNSTGKIVKFVSPSTNCSSTPVGSSTQLSRPYGVTVAHDGSVFVSDTDNNRIVKFNASGTYVTSWGTGGVGVPDPDTCALCDPSDQDCKEAFCYAKFNQPKGLAIYTYGGVDYLLVADSGNDRIQAFDLNGNFLGTIGSFGTGVWQFNSPEGIAVGPDGDVYIADSGNDRIQKYSGADLSLLAEFGEGTLSQPEGLTVDNAGSVYVADANKNRIAVFSPDVVVFENGASSKVIRGHNPFSLTLSLQPDAYWNNRPAEVFLWAEVAGAKVYWEGFPLDVVSFTGVTDMLPLATMNVPALSGINLEFLSDASVLPPSSVVGPYTITLCLDSKVNDVFNPSSSVCDSINVTLQ